MEDNFYQDNTAMISSYPVNNNNNNNENSADTLAIISLVIGILSILVSCCGACMGTLPGIAGIVCAAISQKNNGKTGVATAGLVCSIIGTVIAFLWIIFMLIMYIPLIISEMAYY